MPRILASLTGDPPQIAPELTNEEIAAIGYATVQWAYLEHGLFYRTLEAADAANVPLPRDATNSAFAKRLRAFRILIEKTEPDGSEKERTLKLVSKIANAEDKRHKITHGLWDWVPENPKRVKASSFRPNYEFEETFDLEKLAAFCKTLGEINFDLEYPGGLADVEMQVPFVSRSFLLKLGEKDSEGRDHDLATPPEYIVPPRPWRK
ncbi:MAG: hypothetical protein OEQ29_00935 [Alphaproteobacteria bacterium]|nr:hypothetical protein [Alphaproteobacteria bacterium]